MTKGTTDGRVPRTGMMGIATLVVHHRTETPPLRLCRSQQTTIPTPFPVYHSPLPRPLRRPALPQSHPLPPKPEKKPTFAASPCPTGWHRPRRHEWIPLRRRSSASPRLHLSLTIHLRRRQSRLLRPLGSLMATTRKLRHSRSSKRRGSRQLLSLRGWLH